MKARNHVCGWAVAAKRRAKKLHRDRERWLCEAYIVYSRDKLSGAFTGDFASWKTHENAVRTTQRFGLFPFSSAAARKALAAAGWQLAPTKL